jgi:TIR domain-containing protein
MLYDVFLSHSHVDKDWARALFERLSTTDYDGRNLRAWLDARILDPGNLSSARELESALDRSHRLVLVLSPEALGSSWVQHEIAYFTRAAGVGRVIVLKHRAFDLPPALAGCASVDWPNEVGEGPPLAALLERLQPQHCRRGWYRFLR